MKVLIAEQLPTGEHRFVIEAVPATEGGDALTEEFTWGADVSLADAKRETKLLLAAKYGKGKPTPIAAMVGKDL